MEKDFAELTLKLNWTDASYTIYYDSPLLSADIFECFNLWAKSTDDFSEENLVDFIKHSLPGMHCFTQSGFSKFLERFDLEVLPIPPGDN